MGHCIQIIAATLDVASSICVEFPQLRMLRATASHAIIPIEADFIDSVTNARPNQDTDDLGFMLLTDSFLDWLQALSRLGRIAYLETEYFGGQGGQGAVVLENAKVLMEPVWADSGTINDALELIGVPVHPQHDRFVALRLCDYRSNDRILDALDDEQKHEQNVGPKPPSVRFEL
jgi:hypothetical protein